MENNERLLSLVEVMHVTGLSRATVYRARARGELPAYHFGRTVRFATKDVRDWMEKHRD